VPLAALLALWLAAVAATTPASPPVTRPAVARGDSVPAAAAGSPRAGAPGEAASAPDTSLRVPGTVLRFGSSLATLQRRVRLRASTATPPAGATLREATLRIFGLSGEAVLTFEGDRLMRASFKVDDPSPAELDYVEDQLAREGFRRSCTQRDGLERRCEWNARAKVSYLSTKGSLLMEVAPAGPLPPPRTPWLARPTPLPTAPPSLPAAGSAVAPGAAGSAGAAASTPAHASPPAASPAAAPALSPAPAPPETLRLAALGTPDTLAPARVRDSCRAERPERARANGVFGRVGVAVLVDTSGVVLNAVITRSVPVLDPAALECARRYRFEPYRHRGRPARVWVPLSIRFLL